MILKFTATSFCMQTRMSRHAVLITALTDDVVLV